MARPKIDRVARSVRLPAALDAALVARSEKLGVSVSAAFEDAVGAWLGVRRPDKLPAKPVARRDVTPRFKGNK